MEVMIHHTYDNYRGNKKDADKAGCGLIGDYAFLIALGGKQHNPAHDMDPSEKPFKIPPKDKWLCRSNGVNICREAHRIVHGLRPGTWQKACAAIRQGDSGFPGGTPKPSERAGKSLAEKREEIVSWFWDFIRIS